MHARRLYANTYNINKNILPDKNIINILYGRVYRPERFACRLRYMCSFSGSSRIPLSFRLLIIDGMVCVFFFKFFPQHRY